jgi:hypothetical protein
MNWTEVVVAYIFCNIPAFIYTSVAQPFYTRGTLNIVEESWRYANHILHIVGRGGDGLWH